MSASYKAQDAYGVLPEPWKAVVDHEDNIVYYHNVQEQRSQVSRPRVKVKCAPGGRKSNAFQHWKYHFKRPLQTQEGWHPAVAAAFRSFCLTLTCAPGGGKFSQDGDNLMWRIGPEEPIGLILICRDDPAVAVAYDSMILDWRALQAAQQVMEEHGPTAEFQGLPQKCAAILLLHTGFLNALNIWDLPQPNAFTMCCASVEFDASKWDAIQVSPQRQLQCHLESFDLVMPLQLTLPPCTVNTLESLVAQLSTEAHQQHVTDLKSALAFVENLDDMAFFVEWMPSNSHAIRHVVQWLALRFSEWRMKDGRTFAYDHILGKGEITPQSNWNKNRIMPPPLNPEAARSCNQQVRATKGCAVWQVEEPNESERLEAWLSPSKPKGLHDLRSAAAVIQACNFGTNNTAWRPQRPRDMVRIPVGASWGRVPAEQRLPRRPTRPVMP
eukprot:gnl/MRDRNA2_/MRDRNA2_106945_c0_seq1.p1 gnl/MRDRNA2_/MRDRNA2_106945_c0~~gnl/MRDRNA2_/MRDRNA2_106945_c0_seq1.p1  ORF type:complete len:440 (-),score=69.69 gnl/MRDRNA2_/MRDRNA2_106945_c0_seq1:77-1396(-)